MPRQTCLRPFWVVMAKAASAAGIAPSRCYTTISMQQREVDVVIALGSNMGNRGLNLHKGLRRLRELGVQVLRHSALYETSAAYVTDQPAFLNGAVLARTALGPRELLQVLKQVEAEAGRDLAGGRRFGPRPLDLDIVFFGAGAYRDDRLEVPHPRWHERPFVQAPVADLLYRRDTATSTSTGSSGSGPSSVSSSGSRSSATAHGGSHPLTAAGCRAPLPAGDPGSVLGHLMAVRRVWDAALWSGNAAAGSRAGSGGGGGGGGGSGPGSSGTQGGGEVMRRVTPLVNLPGPLPSSSSSSPASASTSTVGRPAGATTAATAASDQGSSTASTSGLNTDGADAVLAWGRRTYIMGILNVTPDSFSDGGRHSGSVGAAVAAAEAMVSAGADVLDVGGQSTRPGAVRLSPQEELGRVMPVIRALRQSRALHNVPLSVDTFYSEVAREAVAAGGANIVNDVSGGDLDPAMHGTVAELGVPYILMHMRGDPGTMTRPEHTWYDSVWRDVGRELQQRAEAAEAAGVAAWNIILDPGVGFAKTAQGNLELLRHLPDLRLRALDGPYAAPPLPPPPSTSSGAIPSGGCSSPGVVGTGVGGFGGPLLVGPSRKRFLAAITGRSGTADPSERDAATAAACVVCVGGGADMVRVHDVEGVRDAVRVADAVYRGGAVTRHPWRTKSSNPRD